MVWNNNSTDELESNIAWDLRRIWAEKIIGTTVQRIQYAMDNEDYPSWFHLMKRDLRCEIFKNLIPEEKKKIDDEIRRVKNIIQTYPQAYLKSTRQPIEHEAIEDALCELYVLMTSLMEDNGLFGKGYVYDEDEI
jgi:hypothetical protein